MKQFTFTFAVITLLLSSIMVYGQVPQQEPKAPELEYCLRLNVKLGESFEVGQIPTGTRNIVPIVGGSFEGNLSGKELKGEVLPGGADYQMKYAGRNELDAIYNIRTDDGVTIHVRNYGLVVMGRGVYYFRCSPKFEAPIDSKYSWMNDAIFLCQPVLGGGADEITLDVWRVK